MKYFLCLFPRILFLRLANIRKYLFPCSTPYIQYTAENIRRGKFSFS